MFIIRLDFTTDFNPRFFQYGGWGIGRCCILIKTNNKQTQLLQLRVVFAIRGNSSTHPIFYNPKLRLWVVVDSFRKYLEINIINIM